MMKVTVFCLMAILLALAGVAHARSLMGSCERMPPGRRDYSWTYKGYNGFAFKNMEMEAQFMKTIKNVGSAQACFKKCVDVTGPKLCQSFKYKTSSKTCYLSNWALPDEGTTANIPKWCGDSPGYVSGFSFFAQN